MYPPRPSSPVRGTAWSRIQRHVPSARRSRYSFSNGCRSSRARWKVARHCSTSSGWTLSAQPSPMAWARERPVKSSQRRLKKTHRPSSAAIQRSTGTESARVRRRGSSSPVPIPSPRTHTAGAVSLTAGSSTGPKYRISGLLVEARTGPQPLGLRPPPLVGQPVEGGRGPGPGRAADGVDPQAVGQAGGQAPEGQLPVAGLGPLVGGDDPHRRAESLEQPGPLAGPERPRAGDVETGPGPGGRPVGLLPAPP